MDVKEPTRYSKREGHEVPGVVAVLCESAWVGLGRVIHLLGDLLFYCELPAFVRIQTRLMLADQSKITLKIFFYHTLHYLTNKEALTVLRSVVKHAGSGQSTKEV